MSVDASGNIFVWKLETTQTMSVLFKLTSHEFIFHSHLIQNYLLALSLPHTSANSEIGADPNWSVGHMQPTHLHTSVIPEEVISASMEKLSMGVVTRSSVELWDLSNPGNKPLINKYLENEFTSSVVCNTPNGVFLAVSSTLGEIMIIDCNTFNVLMTIPVISGTIAKCQGIYSKCPPRQENQVFNINILSVWSDGVIRIHNCRL